MNTTLLRHRHSVPGQFYLCVLLLWQKLFVELPRELRHLKRHIQWLSEVNGVQWCVLCNRPFARGSQRIARRKASA